MPDRREVIDLVDDDEQYESIGIPDDIEAIEAISTAGPSRHRNNSGQNHRVASTGSSKSSADAFDARQDVKMKLAKIDVEVSNKSSHS